MEELLPLRPLGRAAVLPLRQLGVGRRLARAGRRQLGPRPRGGRLRRLGRRARDGRHHRPGRRDRHRAAHRQVRRTASRRRCPATTSRWSSLGTFILAFGWFGFNPGSTLAGTDLRISFVVVNTMLASVTGALAAMLTLMMQGPEARPDDDVQRHAGRPGGDHGAVRVRRSVGGRGDRRHRRRARRLQRLLLRERAASTIRSAPSRSTASTACGA